MLNWYICVTKEQEASQKHSHLTKRVEHKWSHRQRGPQKNSSAEAQ